MSQEDFAKTLTDHHAETPVPALDVNDGDVAKFLLDLFNSLSPDSPITMSSGFAPPDYEVDTRFKTISVDDTPCFNLFSVSTDAYPAESWWTPFLAKRAPHRHRPEDNKFLSIGKDWTFSDDLWGFIFRKCRASNVGWWALTTSNYDRCLLGVFAQDFKTVRTAPVANTQDDILGSLALWTSSALHPGSPASVGLKRPDNRWSTSETVPPPPWRYARILEQGSQNSSSSKPHTRSDTMTLGVRVAYDEKTGERSIVRLAASHLHEMRMKSALKKTGDQLGRNRGTNDASLDDDEVYGITAAEGYRDPDMTMNLSGFGAASAPSLAPPTLHSRQRSKQKTRFGPNPRRMLLGGGWRGSVQQPPPVWDIANPGKYEQVSKWRDEHFGPEGDPDRSSNQLH